ncbi:MAG: hypothetical protein HKN36_00475 [Hellea sp.]|nr:hypothetical protein [Hellea sp.]
MSIANTKLESVASLQRNGSRTSERFAKILLDHKLSESQFREFMGLPYSEALQAARDAIAGDLEYTFLLTNNDKIFSLPEHILPRIPDTDERLKQIYIDRIFEFYLMKYFHSCSDDEFEKYSNISGLEILDRHLKKNKGILLLNSHYGPGHLAQIFLSRLGYPLTTISSRDFYGTIGIENHNISVLQIARNFGAKIVAAGCSVLKDRKILHMTGEGVSGKSGRKHAFFGKKWHIPNGFAYMIERTGAICVPVIMNIDAAGKVSMSLKPRIAPNLSIEDRYERIDRMVTRYVHLLRSAWREDPANVPPIIIRNYKRL